MIDAYYKRPLFYDYCLAVLLGGLLYWLYFRHTITLPSNDVNVSMATDIATIALTLAGFILTLLTVLITFKTAAKIPNASNQEELPLFDLFFSTRYYYDTVDLLKGAIKSLVFVSILGFSLKLVMRGDAIAYLFFGNVIGLVIIVATLLRSLLILTKIVNLQKEK